MLLLLLSVIGEVAEQHTLLDSEHCYMINQSFVFPALADAAAKYTIPGLPTPIFSKLYRKYNRSLELLFRRAFAEVLWNLSDLAG